MSEATAVSRYAGFFSRALGLVVVAGLGFIVAFCSQASSPNYRALWSGILPFAALHAVSVSAYFVLIRNRSRWLAVTIAIFATGSFAELSFRVWM